jgi:hypothetical protein
MTSRKQLHLACLVFALTPILVLTSEVSASEWHPFGLQGIAVRSLAGAPGRLCAGTAGRGVFCLDLRGKPAGWQPLGPEGTTITGLWIDAARPGLIFAAASRPGANVLFRSLDGGRTWVDVGPNLPTTYVSVYSVHGVPGSDTVYAAGGAVWRSDDLGDTWTAHNPGETEGFATAQSTLDVAPTDPKTIWTGGDLLFTFTAMSYVSLSRDGADTWNIIWASDPFTYIPVYDISAHPRLDGAALVGQGARVMRTLDYGASFRYVLTAPVNFVVAWGGRAGNLAFVAGSNQTSTAASQAWLSRDVGETWTNITGTHLGTLKINDLAADERLAGLAFVATNDGVYAFFGAGSPLCHDARRGVDEALLWLGECPPIMSPGPVIQGDAIVASSTALHADSDHVDLGAVYCVIENSDVAFETIDLPDPPVGEFFMILARQEGDVDYGVSSDGLPRRPSTGDCN